MAVEKRKRPMRQKKSDRLTQGINDKAMIEIDFAVAGFDEKSREMDLKWGVDRLVEVVGVVDPNMAMKFGSAMSKTNKAISDNDPEEVAARVGVCIRGMDAMDRLAMQSNCQPASQDVWEIEADGQVYALMRDGRSWPSIRDRHPNAELVTEREMVLAITMYRNSVVGGMVAETKNAFPSAEVISFKGKEYDDEIPF